MDYKKVGGEVFDTVLNVLELPVNLTASTIDILSDGKMDRKFLDNSFSAMYSDHLKSKGQDMKIQDHVLGLALDIALDPTTYLSFGSSAVTKIDDVLKIAKTAGKLQDIAHITKVDDAVKILTETQKTLDLTSKIGRKASKKINDVTKILSSKKGAKHLEKIQTLNSKYLITPENWKDGTTIKRALVSDDVKLIKTTKVNSKSKELNKIIIANFTGEIDKANKALQKFDPIAKGLNNIIDTGATELSEKHIKYIAKKLNIDPKKASYALTDYKNGLESLQTHLIKEEVTDHSLSAMQHFYKVDTVNELLKTDDAVEALIKRQATKNDELFKNVARENNLPYEQWNKEIIDFIETGNKANLNDKSLKVAQGIQDKFDTLRKIDIVAVGGNASRIKEGKYIPRILDNATEANQEVYQKFVLSAGSERTTKDLSFLELQKELAGKEAPLLKENLVELLAETTRKTKDRVKISSLQEGTKAYIAKKADKGLKYIDHKDFKVLNAKERTAEEFIKVLKNKNVNHTIIDKIENFNMSAIKRELPKLVGTTKADELLKWSTTGERVSAYLPEPVLKKLEPILYKNTEYPTLGKKIEKGVRSYLQTWKKWTLAPIPSFHVNNMIDNAQRIFIQDPEAFKHTKKAFDLQRGKTIFVNTPLGKKAFNLDDLIEHGVTGGKYSASEFEAINKLNKINLKESRIKQVFDKAGNFLKGDNALIEKSFKFGNYMEDHPRIMLALSELEKGHNLADAGKKVREIFYDSSELTEFVKTGRDLLMPFLGFSYNNLKMIPKHLAKSWGRTTLPLKLINSSRVDEEQFSVQDKLADSYSMLRTNRKQSIGLSSKFSQMELLEITDKVLNADNVAQGVGKTLLGYAGPFVGMIEAISNMNFKTGENINRTGKEIEQFLGMDIDKNIAYFVKSQARLLRVIDNALQDEEGNYIFDTFAKYGVEKGFETLKKNSQYLLLGSAFNRDLEKSAQNAIRTLGEEASAIKKEVKNALKAYRSTRDIKYKEKYEALKTQYFEVRQEQRFIKREMPKIKREQREIARSVAQKFEINIPIEKTIDFIKEISNKNNHILKKQTKIEVLEVMDGDTIKVRLPNNSIEYVRLSGIDSIEDIKATQKGNIYHNINQEDTSALYNEAKKELERLLMNTGAGVYVTMINSQKRDDYDRPLVKLEVGGYESKKDINQHMLKMGLAKPAFLESIKSESYRKLLKEIADEAERNNKGFWKKIHKGNNFIPAIHAR